LRWSFRLLDSYRVAIGAYLFGAVSILQLHAQPLGLGVPSQFLSMLPYLVTILVSSSCPPISAPPG
jgi:ABC-type uncharacterized transport system permease subunit